MQRTMQEATLVEQERMANPTLSICIPTYQRKEALKNTLEALAIVAENRDGEIEICVSDNGSTDGTYEMLENHAKRHPFIKIRRNQHNMGYDKNLIETLKMATGEYCWMMGDDDPIVPNRVSLILPVLMQDVMVAIAIPKSIGWKNQDTFSKSLYEKQEFQKEYLRNIRKFGSRAKLGGFMGCFIIRRKLLEDMFAKISFQKTSGEFYGWAHLAFFLYVVSNYNGKIAIIRENILDETAADRINQTWKNDKTFLPAEMIKMFLDRRQKAMRILPCDGKFIDDLCAALETERGMMLAKAWMKMIALYGEINTELYERFRADLKKHPLELLVGNKIVKQMFILVPSMKAVVRDMKAYEAGRMKTNSERECAGNIPVEVKCR